MQHIILIPVYNDWESLNLLLTKIDKSLKKRIRILIINDASTEIINIKKNKLKKIEKIIILTLSKNLGSQKAISIGLDYLKKNKKKTYITIMDGDGEDDPAQLNKMMNLAEKNKDFVITSNRTTRNENLIIQIGYKVHLIISFFFTWNWISFGNFTSFYSNNLKKINLKKVWYAYPSAVLNSCKIKKIFSRRKKRFFGNSKVNLIKLIEHSFRIIGVFSIRVIIMSILLFIFFSLVIKNNFFLFLILFFNLLIFYTKIKNFPDRNIDYRNYLNSIKYF